MIMSVVQPTNDLATRRVSMGPMALSKFSCFNVNVLAVVYRRAHGRRLYIEVEAIIYYKAQTHSSSREKELELLLL